MADKSQNDLMKEAVELLKLQAQQQMAMNNSLDSYVENLKKLKSIYDTVTANRKIEKDIQDKLQKAGLAGDMKLVRQERLKLKILKQQTAELESQGKILVDQVKQVNTLKLTSAKLGASLVKGFGKLPELVQNSFGKLSSYGLFKMDGSIKKSALSMGILSKQSTSFRSSIVEASKTTIQLGVGVEDLAKIQGDYSEELGRTVMLSQSGLEAMGKMAAATGLGAEGAAKLAADMENQGISAERTASFVEQTMDDAHKMGLNASKVIKNIQNNMKLLNKYNFKGGVKGLAKMAETTTKLGVDMNFVAGMADKLFDIEGAVDMSAQLQVMGGEWAKLADPFKLMYMARNDMEGLTEAIGNAAASSAHFNKETGEFEISALEMHRLRKVAEQTGVAYEDLAQAGKNAAKFSKIKTQMSFDIDEETKEFLSTTAKFNNKGEAYIMVDGSQKLLKSLTTSDKQLLKAQVLEKQSLTERAKTAQTFDDQLTNMMNMFKTAALPLIESINKNLMPKVQKLFDKIIKEKWFEKIGDLAGTVGKWIASIAGFMVDNPILTGVGVLTAKLGGFLLDKLTWFNNGQLLAEGFAMGTGKSGGFMNMLGDLITGGKGGSGSGGGGAVGKMGSIFKGAAGSKLLKLGGVATGLLEAFNEYSENKKKGMDTKENVGRSGAKGLGAGLGAWGGAAAGAAIGSIIPGVGTVIGGVIGGALGAWGGSAIGGEAGDLIYGDKMDDAAFGGTSSDRAIIQGGQITPIDNKDDLIAAKPNGAVDRAMRENNSTNMKVEFGEIHFKFDELRVTSPGSPGIAIDLLKDPQFIRNITRMIHVETNKAINGGKISPNPR